MAKKARGPKLYKELKNSGVIFEADFKYMQEKPDGDVGFNADKNRKVVEQVIRETDAMEKKKLKEYMTQVEERVDAGYYFLRKLAQSKVNNPYDASKLAMKYFGRRELARLRGNEIAQEIRQKIAMSKNIVN